MASINYYIITLAFLTSLLSKGQGSPDNQLPKPEPSKVKCTYRLTFQPDSTVKATRTEYCHLLIGKTLSRFETAGSYAADSLRSTYPKVITRDNTNIQAYVDQRLKLPYTKFNYLICKTAAAKQLYCFDWIGDAFYHYAEPNDSFQWKITPDKATVAGYACQRATVAFAGRVFEAWFTREIPISEGPYKFYGLPGLIVKVNDLQHYYSFELVKLARTGTPVVIALPTKPATLTTKSQLRRGQEAYYLGMAERASAMGNKVDEATRQRMRKQLTPLELR